jgi:hypothetical protein
VLPLFAVELSSATNEQLLAELRGRLNGVVVEGNSAIASYICDASGYLNVSLTSQTSADSKKFYIGAYQDCNSQSKTLAAKKSKISQVTFMAVCDASGYLNKYAVYPFGKFGNEEKIYLGTMADCIVQANQINAN